MSSRNARSSLPLVWGWQTEAWIKPDAEIGAEGREELAFERRPIIKDDRVGDDLPLPHRRDQRCDRGPLVWSQEEITEDVAARVIIQEGEVVGGTIQIRQGHLFQEVAMPKTMRMMAFIKPPDGWGSWWALLITERTLEALDGRGTDLEVMLVLQIPCEPFGAKVRGMLDSVSDDLLGLCRQALGLPTWGRPFGHARQGETLPHPLNRSGTRGLRAASLPDLRGTPGGMALAD